MSMSTLCDYAIMRVSEEPSCTYPSHLHLIFPLLTLSLIIEAHVHFTSFIYEHVWITHCDYATQLATVLALAT